MIGNSFMKNKNISRLLALITIFALTFSMTLSFDTGEVFAEDNVQCQALTGSNIGANDYYWYYSNIPTSYLTPAGDGVMGVAFNGGKVVASYYDENLDLVSRQTIDPEGKELLPIYGGFYAYDNCYYIVTGDTNTEESDEKEVFRVTKYDANWNYLGSDGLFGSNTTIPFDAGRCSMEMFGNDLIIRTCHEMYTSSDGLNHQASVLIVFDSVKMAISAYDTDVSNWSKAGYVSHSFNQYIAVNGNEYAFLDHGDAYPRAAVLQLFSVEDGEDISFSNAYYQGELYVESYPGSTGDNFTGATLGGLAAADTGYLVVGTSMYQHEDYNTYTPRDAFVTYIDNQEETYGRQWLTNVGYGTTATNPYIVRITGTKFMVTWTQGNDLYFTFVDNHAEPLTDPYVMEGGALSDCQPILYNDKVLWHTWDEGKETFYVVPVDNPEDAGTVTKTYGHDWVRTGSSGDQITLTCNNCGEVTTGEAPYDILLYWLEGNDDDGTHWGTAYVNYCDIDGCLEYLVNVDGESGSPFNDYEIVADDPDAVRIDDDANKIYFNKTGPVTVTARCKYAPDISTSTQIYVTEKLESVELEAYQESPQEFGTDVQLTASTIGGVSLNYQFTATDENGAEEVISDSDSNSCTWHTTKPGEFTIKVKVTDGRFGTEVEDSISFTLDKKDSPDELPAARYVLPNSTETLSEEAIAKILPDNWILDDEVVGMALESGREYTFTAHYNGEDSDYYRNLDFDIVVVRSTCEHLHTERQGAVASTCCIQGETGDLVCKDCGEIIEYSTSLPLDPDKHEHTSVVEGYPASYQEDGLTDSIVCDDCGAVIQEAEVIDGIYEVWYDLPSDQYNGKPKTIDWYVETWDDYLVEGRDYTVQYYNNIYPGTATAILTLSGNYEGVFHLDYEIVKGTNPLTVKTATTTVKYKKLKKKKQTIKAGKAIKVSKAAGKVTYKKVSGNKKITISSSGKITLKKKLKKGTYKVKVKVTAAGNANYKSRSKTVTIKIKVK